MLIQAYMTASIHSRQVDADMTKHHSPGYLGDRMLVDFPLSLCVGIKAVWKKNERNSSGCELRTSLGTTENLPPDKAK